MNNIFNPHEFHLYGLGEIVEPDSPCNCFYSPECKEAKHCMKDLPVIKVLNAMERVL
jgi:heptosyltransferase-2